MRNLGRLLLLHLHLHIGILYMNDSIYQPPQVELVDTRQPALKASRVRRFFASMIDSILISVVVLPAMYWGGLLDLASSAPMSWGYTLSSGAMWAVVFILFNGLLLIQRGQTIGKMLLSIKIVKEDSLPADGRTLLIRYAVYFFGNLIPVIGAVFALVNLLFIFGERKQCLHDRIANTIVVNA
jgi:uncharacterized RDD family membrane protein YckC